MNEAPSLPDGAPAVAASPSAKRRHPDVVLVGLGDEWRRDDGVGYAVLRRVADLSATGLTACRVAGNVDEPLDLVGIWDGADLAVVVDAVRSGAEPGSVHVIDLDDLVRRRDPLPVDPAEPMRPPPGHSEGAGRASTHTLGVGLAFRLARALGSAPRRAVIVGVEGGDFSQGAGLTPAVRDAVERAASLVVELAGGASCQDDTARKVP